MVLDIIYNNIYIYITAGKKEVRNLISCMGIFGFMLAIQHPSQAKQASTCFFVWKEFYLLLQGVFSSELVIIMLFTHLDTLFSLLDKL